jgi:hypothetical protein
MTRQPHIARGLLLALLASSSSACSLIVDAVESTPAGGRDAGSGDADAEVDEPCLGWPRLAEEFDTCDHSEPSQNLLIDGNRWTFDTDTGDLNAGFGTNTQVQSVVVQLANGTDARMILVNNFRIDSELEAFGSMSLVIAAWGRIEVNGSLRVDGFGDTPGPGANPSSCNPGARGSDGVDNAGGASGAGGGANGGAGGNGGNGNADDPTAPGGDGGQIDAGRSGLQGGCPGGTGANAGGAGGNGGGAVALVALDNLLVRGNIEAVGRGGKAGRNDRSGGGGGGAGGAIWLVGNGIELTSGSKISANGGGGGGGAEQFADGGDGEKGRLDESAAQGGNSPAGGGDGGRGSSVSNPDGTGGGVSFAGGGGGGGGAGVIVIDSGSGSRQIRDGAVVSPPARDDPP